MLKIDSLARILLQSVIIFIIVIENYFNDNIFICLNKKFRKYLFL